jgi:peptide chain release factor 1
MRSPSWSSSTASIRSSWCWSDFDHEVLEARSGFLLMRVTGVTASSSFAREVGGHRFQRVPPNEKRGRVHTSTVTVAVLNEPAEHEVRIDPRDLEESFTRGSGPGGQHRQKNDTCVVLTHLPSRIVVRVDGGRSQHLNRQMALGLLRARLQADSEDRLIRARNEQRRRQVGSGMRGDKRRTVAIQRDTVTDHVTGKTMRAKHYLQGKLHELW